MRDIGKITRPMVGADLFILMETSTKDNGKMTRPMEEEYTTTTMAPATMDNGLKIYSKVKVSKNGMMDRLMRGNYLFIQNAS